MPFVWWIACRYLKAKRQQKFISLITWISVLGIVVGVMALITVLSVMTGFDRHLTEKIVGTNPHIIMVKESGIKNYKGLAAEVKKEIKIEAVSPLVEGPVLISSPLATLAIAVRGINPKEEEKVTSIGRYITSGALTFPDKTNKIILGQELAKRLGVKMEDKVTIIPSPKAGKDRAGVNIFIVGGLFKSGMYEFDASLAYVSLEKGQELFAMKGHIQALGLKVADYHRANSVAQKLRERFGVKYEIRSWMEARANLFTALKMEKTVMFVVVALVTVVAAFNISGTLIMMVMEKRKDIAILKTVGVSSARVMAIFTTVGAVIGLTGTLIGVVAGVKLAKSLDTILNFLNRLFKVELFSPRIYYLDKLPVIISFQDVIIIALCSLALSLMAALYPAWQASRLSPIEALRYE